MAAMAFFRQALVASLAAGMLLGCGQGGDDQDQANAGGGTAAPAASSANAQGSGQSGGDVGVTAAATKGGVSTSSTAPAAMAVDAAPAGDRSRELTDPNGDALGWVYLDWSGTDPELAAAAERNVGRPGTKIDGETVNEFNRAELVAKEQARLQSLFDAHKGVGFLTFNISGNLSDYDPNYGEFYISAFSPGSSVGFGTFHQNRYSGGTGLKNFSINMKLNNALDAYVWKLTPDEAAKVIAAFEREGGATTYRRIYARTKLKILSAEASSAQARSMNAQILSFTLFTQKGTRLGHFDLTQ
ncbi:MAG: hypothetical protein Tsb0016_10730 [Sphingomonadales bacterium]